MPGNTNSGAGSPGTTNNVGQANMSRDAMLRGLVNLNLQNVNVQASDLININDSLNGTQVQAIVQALNVNPQATAVAERLTTTLRNQGLLQQGQRVVGANDGKIFISSGAGANANTPAGGASGSTGAGTNSNTPSGGASGSAGAGTNPPMPGGASGNTNTGAGSPGTTNNTTQGNVSRDAMLTGLVNLNVQNANVQASDLVNINNALNDVQLQAHIQALNVNARANSVAENLTSTLRNQGLLQQGQRVVGAANGKIFITADRER